MGEDLQHAGQLERVDRIDPRNPPCRDGAGNDITIGEIWHVVFGGVLRFAAHLGAAIDTAGRFPNVCGRHSCCSHSCHTPVPA